MDVLSEKTRFAKAVRLSKTYQFSHHDGTSDKVKTALLKAGIEKKKSGFLRTDGVKFDTGKELFQDILDNEPGMIDEMYETCFGKEEPPDVDVVGFFLVILEFF
jgi:hypothetical protein